MFIASTYYNNVLYLNYKLNLLFYKKRLINDYYGNRRIGWLAHCSSQTCIVYVPEMYKSWYFQHKWHLYNSRKKHGIIVY